MLCKILGHKFWRKENVDYLCYGKIKYDNCVRCGSPTTKPKPKK